MTRHTTCFLACAVALATSACTGLTVGENTPGGDTYLENGSIAVDPYTDVSYVLRRSARTDEEGVEIPASVRKHLFAVDPGADSARHVADVSDLEDLRMVFPRGEILVMGERDERDTLRLIDPVTGEVTRELATDARYHGTRLSPSGRFLVVGDNASPDGALPIHIIDTETFETVVLPHDGMWAEAQWANGSDILVAMVDYHRSWGITAPDPEAAEMRLLAWDIAALATNGYPVEGGIFAEPLFDIRVPDATRDSAFSYSWVAVDSSDTVAAFPVRVHRPDATTPEGPGGFEGWQADLLVVDIASGELQRVENAFGPVGFSPDGSTIVSYRYVEDGSGEGGLDPELLLVDATTLESEATPLPLDGGPSFFVTREGHWVVVAAAFGTEQLVLFDLEDGSSTRVAGEPVGLFELVSRPGHPELWLVDERDLFRLDMMSAVLDPVALSMPVDRINIIPRRDELVLGNFETGTLLFYDLVAGEEGRTVVLPPAMTMD